MCYGKGYRWRLWAYYYVRRAVGPVMFVINTLRFEYVNVIVSVDLHWQVTDKSIANPTLIFLYCISNWLLSVQIYTDNNTELLNMAYGINGTCLSWISNFLLGRSQSVKFFWHCIMVMFEFFKLWFVLFYIHNHDVTFTLHINWTVFYINICSFIAVESNLEPVSYTHLTLPTKRIV